MGGLPMFALMLAAARRQAILGRRSAREELEAKRTERELRKLELQSRIDAQKQKATADAAQPFEQALYGPGAQDFLSGQAQQGTLPEFIRNADTALKAAGRPFNPEAYLIPPPQPGPEQLAPMATASAMQMLGLPGAAQVQGMAPELPDVAQLYQQRYRPSAKTQAGLQRALTAEDLAQARIPLFAAQAGLAGAQTGLTQERTRSAAAQADVDEATVQAEIRQALADAANAEAQGDLIAANTARQRAAAATDNYLRVARRRLLGEQAEYLDERPDLTREGFGVTMRGQDIGAATTRRGQDIGAQTADEDRAERREGRAAKPGGMTDVDKKNWDFHAARLRQTNKTAAGEDEPAYPPGSAEYQESAGELDRLRGKYGNLPDFLGGRGGVGQQFSEAQINDMARRINNKTADSFIQNAPPELQATLRAIRQEVLARRKTKR